MTSTRPSIHLEFLVLWGKTCSASFPDLIHERTLLPCPLTYASPPRLFHRLASGMEVFLLELACKSVEVTLYHSILHRWFLPMERTDLCPQFLLPVGFSFQRPQVAKEWTLQSCPPTALQNLGSGWWGAGEGGVWRGRRHMYTHPDSWYSRNQHNIVKQLSSSWNKQGHHHCLAPMDDITDSVDMSLRKLQEIKDREAWGAAIYGVAKSWTRLSDWTKTKNQTKSMSFFQRRWLSSARASSENIALQKQISKLLGLFLCAQPGKKKIARVFAVKTVSLLPNWILVRILKPQKCC